MEDKIKKIRERFESLKLKMSDPKLLKDPNALVSLGKEYKQLAPIVASASRYAEAKASLRSAQDFLVQEKDEDLRTLAKEEIELKKQELAKAGKDIKRKLLGSEPEDVKSAK